MNTAWLGVFAVLFVLHLSLLACIVRHRKVYPFREREPTLLIGCSVVGVVWVSEMTLNLAVQFPCVVSMLFRSLPANLYPFLYMLRAFHLVMKYHITREQEDCQLTGGMFVQQWYTAHRYLIKPRFLFWLSLGFFSVLSLVVAIGIMTMPTSQDLVPCPSVPNQFTRFCLPFTVINLLVLIIFGYKLRDVEDNFGIKTEFRFLFVACVVSSILTAGFDVFDVSMTIIITLVALFSALWPMHVRRKMASYDADTLVEDDLPRLLLEPNFYTSFFGFLKSEFSIENLLFWSHVNDYRALGNGDDDNLDKLRSEAVRLFETYVRMDAPGSVNLSGDVAARIRKHLLYYGLASGSLLSDSQADPARDLLDDVPRFPNIFDEAVTEVLSMLTLDSYARFKRTPQGKQRLSVWASSPLRQPLQLQLQSSPRVQPTSIRSHIVIDKMPHFNLS